MMIAVGITWLLDGLEVTLAGSLASLLKDENARPDGLGRFFDSIGRKKMITATYGLSGLLLIGSALTFRGNHVGAIGQDVWFTAILFVALSAASSAYLTVSEVFPLEIRAFAISIFHAIGALAGGVGAPILFARLGSSGSRSELFWGTS
jgi:MFS family permease